MHTGICRKEIYRCCANRACFSLRLYRIVAIVNFFWAVDNAILFIEYTTVPFRVASLCSFYRTLDSLYYYILLLRDSLAYLVLFL